MPLWDRCDTNEFSGRALPILLREVIKSPQWEDAPAILSAFKDVILKLTNGLDADAAASLEKLLSELPAPEKNINCSYLTWTEMPTGLKQCIKTTGSCYDRVIATFSCLVESGMKAGEDSKSAMICQMLSSFADVAGDKETEVSKLLSGQVKNRNCQEIVLDYRRRLFMLRSGSIYPRM